jgi:predicted NAD/FAD-binding protein
MRIAIVGAGVSGLVCARLLHKSHDVRVFEASEWAGGHAHTVRVDTPVGAVDVETGFVVYNERTYPLFTRLLADLGIATRATEMSFGVHCERTGLSYNGGSLRGLFAQPRNLLRPAFLGMLRDVLRFYREAPALLDAPDAKLSLGEWLAGRGYGDTFVERHLLPMGAAIWSCEPGKVAEFPVLAFARFFANHGLLQLRDRPQWRCIDGGSARYVERLVTPFRERVHVREAVRGVRRFADRVELALASGALASFDRVVFANHADQSLASLRDPTRAERAILSAIRYEPNDVVLHSDASLLPSARRARAAWNFHIPAEKPALATVTYDMARLQRVAAPLDLLVTLNRTHAIDARRIHARFSYHHPVFDRAALEAQAERAVISGANRTHYCGAYWGYGFHEDGVRSAHKAAAELLSAG